MEKQQHSKMKIRKPKHKYQIDMSQMKAVTPKEWLQRILTLPREIRAEVAKIVWWDFFAHRLVGQRWAELDPFLAYCHTPPALDKYALRDRLVEIGYIFEFASRRSGVKLKQRAENE